MDGSGRRGLFPPPLPAPKSSTREKKGKRSAEAERGGFGDVSRVERSRRSRMNESYAMLQAIVPNAFPKATKAKIIDETVSYIKELKDVVRLMEEKKRARCPTAASIREPAVDMAVLGRTAFFGLRAAARPGLARQVLLVFEERNVEVLSATIVQGERRHTTNMTVTALVDDDPCVVEKLKNDLLFVLH